MSSTTTAQIAAARITRSTGLIGSRFLGRTPTTDSRASLTTALCLFQLSHSRCRPRCWPRPPLPVVSFVKLGSASARSPGLGRRQLTGRQEPSPERSAAAVHGRPDSRTSYGDDSAAGDQDRSRPDRGSLTGTAPLRGPTLLSCLTKTIGTPPPPRKDAPASHHLGGLDDQRKSRAWVLDYVRRHPGYFRMLVRDGDSAGSEN